MVSPLTLSADGWTFLRRFEGDVPAADITALQADLATLLLAPLSAAQADALISFVYSIGFDAFARSDVAQRLAAGHVIAAADGFDAWRRAEAPEAVAALIARRAAEKALFLSAVAPVPTAAVRAAIDHSFSLVTAPRGRTPDAPPAPVGPLPGRKSAEIQTSPAAPPMPANDITARLKAIMAAEPATQPALRPPPAPQADADEDAFELIPAVREARTAQAAPAQFGTVSMGALGLIGALLLYFAGSAYAEGAEHGRFALLMFGAPGVMAVTMALYYLVRKKV
jgi:hypothetical protein